MSTPMTALGLMSGTSLDGVDVALLTTDGATVQALGPAGTVAYDPAFRAELRSILGGQGPVAQVERTLTEFHAAVVDGFLRDHAIAPDAVDVIGFHGHTILHQPHLRKTWQIGDGARLAALIGLPVVCDFRGADVAAGGQGAPLVPVFHRALAHGLPRPLAVLNIGGVANVTWIGEDGAMLAFDTGPGNALIDDWVLRHTGQSFDDGGGLAATGKVDFVKLGAFLSHPYFAKAAPKSLDRDDFGRIAGDLAAGLSAEDGAATLTAFTVSSVAAAQDRFPRRPERWLVTGGGRHNATLMAGLTRTLETPVDPVEAVGWNGDALEAQAFAFLAVRSRRNLPLTYPETTGGPRPLTGGRYFMPEGKK